MYIINNNLKKHISSAFLILITTSLLSGCVTQSFENNEPIVKSQANRDEMAATRISLGLGYLKMGDMPQAKMNLEKAKRFSPNLVQVQTAFAHYYETVGENKLAIESFEQALVLKADSADTLNNYGVFLCRQGDVEAAEVQFLKAIAVPSYLLVSQSYENLSSCYLQHDNFEKAEMYLEKSIFHSPNRTTTLLQMVRLKYAMGDYKEAKRYLHKFERNTQRFTADSLSLAYKLYWRLGQRRTASNYANMLVKMYPQSWEGKQYVLNELQFIAADDLAKRYEVSERKKNKTFESSSTKRVVRLSPKTAGSKSAMAAVKPQVEKTTVQVSSQTAGAESPILQNTNTQNTNAQSSSTQNTNTQSANVQSTMAAPKSAASGSGVITSAAQATVGAGSAIAATTASTTAAAAVVGASAVVASTNTNSTEEPVVNNPESLATEVKPTEEVVAQSTTPIVATDTEILAAGTSTAVIANDSQVTGNTTEFTSPENHQVSATAVVDESNFAEPTSTQPIAAQRDVPLPEPIVEPIPEVAVETVALESEVAEVNAVNAEDNDMRTVAKEDAMHTVVSGQNLYNISVKYNVRLSALRKWNNISENNNIRIGEKLYVVDPQTVKIN